MLKVIIIIIFIINNSLTCNTKQERPVIIQKHFDRSTINDNINNVKEQEMHFFDNGHTSCTGLTTQQQSICNECQNLWRSNILKIDIKSFTDEDKKTSKKLQQLCCLGSTSTFQIKEHEIWSEFCTRIVKSTKNIVIHHDRTCVDNTPIERELCTKCGPKKKLHCCLGSGLHPIQEHRSTYLDCLNTKQGRILYYLIQHFQPL